MNEDNTSIEKNEIVDSSQDEADTQAKKTVDVFPIGKGKRTLVFICDLVIAFIVAFSLFNFAAFPIAKQIIRYDDLSNEANEAGLNRDSVLFDNKLLFAKGDSKKYSSENLEYTFDRYLSNYVVEENADYEVFKTFYVNIRKDEKTYLDIYKNNDEPYGFFSFDTGLPKLKSKYVEEFMPSFVEGDEMSDSAKTDYDKFKKKFFLFSYSDLLGSISESNDLFSSNGTSYYENQNKVYQIGKHVDQAIVISVYISFAIALLVCFLLFPLLQKNRKTFAMLFMRIERINVSNLMLLRKRDVLLPLVYYLASGASMLMFISLPTTSIEQSFNLGLFFPLSLVSLGYVLVSLIFMLFNGFNRTLGDFLTGTVYISEDSLDDIYRSKGYII